MLPHHDRYSRSKSWRRRCRQFAALREDVQEYKAYVAAAGTQIGELTPLSGEDVHDIRRKVAMAARAMGLGLRTWVDEGKVYFYVRRDTLSVL